MILLVNGEPLGGKGLSDVKLSSLLISRLNFPLFPIDAPRFYYLPGSFTEYKLPGEERRRKRGIAAEPADLLDRYGSYIAMQLRINPEVDKAYFLYVTSETNLEYSILGVCIFGGKPLFHSL